MNTGTKLVAVSQVVTLLRLSPLLPLALSNYLYGLTSVDLPSYVAGSWLGMLPGTIAYVTAGASVVARGIYRNSKKWQDTDLLPRWMLSRHVQIESEW